MIWTEELSNRLVELWKQKSATEIAALFCAEGIAVSRNSIVGRVHRMNLPCKRLPGRPTNSGGAPRTRKARAKAISAGPIKIINRGPIEVTEAFHPKTVEVVSLDIRLVDLEPVQCRFVCARIDDEWRFCGHPAKDGGSWCPYHHALVWNPRAMPTKQSPHHREAKRRAA